MDSHLAKKLVLKVVWYNPSKMMHEISRDVVRKKAKQVFPNEKIKTIIGLLDQYGVESYEREQARVQLAILKLSEGNLDKLLQYIKAARTDYRDVLAWAEYPEEMKAGFSRESNAANMQAIRQRDRQQYLDWLNSDES